MTQTDNVISAERSIKYFIKNNKCMFLCFTDLLEVIADPDGDRCAPVTIPWNRPVTRVSQPVPKTLLTHKLWNPAETERLWWVVSIIFFYIYIKHNNHRDNQTCMEGDAHVRSLALEMNNMNTDVIHEPKYITANYVKTFLALIGSGGGSNNLNRGRRSCLLDFLNIPMQLQAVCVFINTVCVLRHNPQFTAQLDTGDI